MGFIFLTPSFNKQKATNGAGKVPQKCPDYFPLFSLHILFSKYWDQFNCSASPYIEVKQISLCNNAKIQKSK